MVNVNVKANGKKTDQQIIITAIVCITLLECLALALGFNGQVLRWVLIIIAGLAGLMLPTPKLKRG